MYPFYESPTTLDEALRLKAQYGDNARIIAGGTDLLIELDRGVRKTADGGAPGLIDLTRVPGLADFWEAGGWIHLGALVTHNQCVASPLIVEKAFPLARACWEVGAPQIRNRGTVAGNLITASPANDAIVPLLALDATVTVRSAGRGDRHMALDRFITGFRKVDLRPDEILTRISFRALTDPHAGAFIKLGLRRAQAISVMSVAAVLQYTASRADAPIKQARISLGAVAPVVVRAKVAEDYLAGTQLTDEVISEAARLAVQAANPIDDIRSSVEYRLGMVEALVARSLRQIRDGQAQAGWSGSPIMLWGNTDGRWPVVQQETRRPGDKETGRQGQTSNDQSSIINGQSLDLGSGMTLLDSLRAAGFVGVKEGCAEGECGACTVFLDGMAVMACMVPAERAAGSEVVTVEGLGNPAQLHPVQAAFVQSGGVQCGYCTPGFVMSAAKLLEERPHPTREEAQQALTGNLCRCTGYRKILDAVVMAGHVQYTKVDSVAVLAGETNKATVGDQSVQDLNAQAINALHLQLGKLDRNQVKAWRSMSPPRRLELAFQAYQFALDVVRRTERQRFPHLIEDEMNWRITRRMQGNQKLAESTPMEPVRDNELRAFFGYVVEVLERLGIPYMVVGGFAAIFYGEPRLTLDVDIVADMQPQHVKAFVQAFPIPEYYISEEAVRDALVRRYPFNVIQPSTGAKVDMVPLPKDIFTRLAFQRRQPLEYDDQHHTAAFITAEDIVLAKLIAHRETGSEKHLRDARGVLLLQWEQLNLDAVRRGAQGAGVLDQLERLVEIVQRDLE